MADKEPKDHGGKREGAGRKPDNETGKKLSIALRLAPDTVSVIKAQPNQSAFIESLVRQWKERNT